MSSSWLCVSCVMGLTLGAGMAWADAPEPAATVVPPMPMDVDPLPPAPGIPNTVPVAPIPWNGNLGQPMMNAPTMPPQPGVTTVMPPSQGTGIGTRGAGPAAGQGPFWAPGGYDARIGSPYLYHDPNGGQYVVTGNPYYDHYGPGFHRSDLHGHYRFPYYNYRAPWYYPGRAVYNRDTNYPW
ncbi:hypothetical protein GC163_01410 [bacterium]|nr:hypothetical protein [bacterium]